MRVTNRSANGTQKQIELTTLGHGQVSKSPWSKFNLHRGGQNSFGRNISGPCTLFIDDAQYNSDAAKAHGWTGVRFDNSAQVRQDLLLMGAL